MFRCHICTKLLLSRPRPYLKSKYFVLWLVSDGNVCIDVCKPDVADIQVCDQLKLYVYCGVRGGSPV